MAGHTVYRSLDGGATWERDSGPFPRKVTGKGLAYRRQTLRRSYPNADVKLEQRRG